MAEQYRQIPSINENYFYHLLELIFQANSKKKSAAFYLKNYGNIYFDNKEKSQNSPVIKSLNSGRIQAMCKNRNKTQKTDGINFLEKLPPIIKKIFSFDFGSFLNAIQKIISIQSDNQILIDISQMNLNEIKKLLGNNDKKPKTLEEESVSSTEQNQSETFSLDDDDDINEKEKEKELINDEENQSEDVEEELLPIIDMPTALENQPKDIKTHGITEIPTLKRKKKGSMVLPQSSAKYVSEQFFNEFYDKSSSLKKKFKVKSFINHKREQIGSSYVKNEEKEKTIQHFSMKDNEDDKMTEEEDEITEKDDNTSKSINFEQSTFILKNQIIEYNTKIENLEKERELILQENTQLKNQITEYNTKIENLNKEGELIFQENTQLKNQITEYNTKIENLNKEGELILQENTQLKNQITEYNTKIENLNKEGELIFQENIQLKNELQSKTNQLIETQNIFQTAQNQYDNQQSIYNELKLRIETECDLQIRNLETEKKTLENELKIKSDELISIQTDLQTFQQQHEIQNNELKKEYDQKIDEMKYFEKTVESLGKKNNELNDTITSNNTIIEIHEQNIEELKEDSKILQTTIDDIKKENERLKHQLETNKQQHKKILADNETEIQQKEDEKKQQEQFQKKLITAKEKLEKENKKLNEENNTLKKHLDIYNQSITENLKENQQLTQEITLLKKQLDSDRIIITEHESQIKSFTKLKADYTELQNQWTQLNAIKTQSENELVKQIQTLEKDLETTHIQLEIINDTQKSDTNVKQNLQQFIKQEIEPYIFTKDTFKEWIKNKTTIQNDPNTIKSLYEEIHPFEKSFESILKEFKKQLLLGKSQYHKNVENLITTHKNQEELVIILKNHQENINEIFQKHLNTLTTIQDNFTLQSSINKVQNQLQTRNELLETILTLRQKQEQRYSEGKEMVPKIPQLFEFDQIPTVKSTLTKSTINLKNPSKEESSFYISKAISIIFNLNINNNYLEIVARKDLEIAQLKEYIDEILQKLEVQPDHTIKTMLNSQAEIVQFNNIIETLKMENDIYKNMIHNFQNSSNENEKKYAVEAAFYKHINQAMINELEINRIAFSSIINCLKEEWNMAYQSMAEYYQFYQLEIQRMQAELNEMKLCAEVENMEIGGEEFIEMSEQIIALKKKEEELFQHLKLIQLQSDSYKLTLKHKCDELNDLKRSIMRRQEQYDARMIKRTYMSGDTIVKKVNVALPNGQSEGHFFKDNNHYYFNEEEGKLKRKPLVLKKDKKGNIDVSEFLPLPSSLPNLILKENQSKYNKHSSIVFYTLRESSKPLLYDYAIHVHLIQTQETPIDIESILYQTAAFIKIEKSSKLLALKNLLLLDEFKYNGGINALLHIYNTPATNIKIRMLYFFVKSSLKKTRFPIVAYSIFTMLLSLFYDLKYDKTFDANVISLFPQSSIDSNAIRIYEDKHRVFFKRNTNVFKFSINTIQELLTETGHGLEGRHRLFEL